MIEEVLKQLLAERWKVILAVALLYLLKKFLDFWTSPLRKIPSPPGHFLFKHLPVLKAAKNEVNLVMKWANQFSNEKLFKIKRFNGNTDWEVITTDYDLTREAMLNTRVYEKNTIKFLGTYLPIMKDGLLLESGKRHAMQRKLLNKAFNSISMKNYTPCVNRETTAMLNQMEDLVGNNAEGVVYQPWTQSKDMTMQVICKVAFGYELEDDGTSSSDVLGDRYSKNQGTLNHWIPTFTLFPWLLKLPFGPGKSLKDSEDKMAAIIDQAVKKRREKIASNQTTGEEDVDMLSLLLKAHDDETSSSLTDREVQANLVTFLLAGHETTATAIPWVMYALAKRPEVQDKARAEIQSVLGDGDRHVGADDFMAMPYTVACIKEALRMHPPVPGNKRIPNKDITFGKYTIPKGTVIWFPTDAFHEVYFENAHEFIPERWYNEESLKPMAFKTFGYGPYNCIGKGLSMLELKVLIVRILNKFRFTLDPSMHDPAVKLAVTIKSDVEVRMHLLKCPHQMK